MKKKREMPEDQKQPTLKESATEEFHRADVIGDTKKMLKNLPTKKNKNLPVDQEKDLFLKRVKEEVAKKIEEN